jgi:hypothetical protein
MWRRQTPYGACEGTATATTTPTSTRSLFLFTILIAVSLSHLSSSCLVNAVNLRSTNEKNSNTHVIEQQQQQLQHDALTRRRLAQLDVSLLDSHFHPTTLHTVVTNYKGTTGGNGLMFDVQTSTDVPPGGLRVLTLDLHIDSSPEEQYLSVFTKLGSFVGEGSNPHAWRRVFSGTVVSEGGGKPTRLPPDMFDSITIHRGSSQAFYVVMEEPLLKYGDGTNVGHRLAEDSFLQISEGSGIAQVFGGSIGPGTFNGAVHYDLVDSKGSGSGKNSIMVPEGPTHSLVTSTEGGNTAFGIMFDVISIKGIQLQSLQVHLANDGDQQQDADHDNELDLASLNIEPQQANTVTMKVYTLEGSHAGREKYPAEWTLLGVVQVTPQGLGKMTEIPLGSFTPVDLLAGTRHAFYITADRSVMQYTDGTVIHNVVNLNEHMMLLEGTALGRSYFGGLFQPRAFNGGLIYQELEEVLVPEIN